MVNIFTNRIEFTNAGELLIPEERIVDSVQISRNEGLAGFMRKCGVCEECGSGYDKIVGATSTASLISPRAIDQRSKLTKQALFSKIPFESATKEDRARRYHMLACLTYLEMSATSNTDVRRVFGLEVERKVQATCIIKDALKAYLIRPVDPMAAPKSVR